MWKSLRRKQVRFRRRLRESWAYHFFGEQLFHKHLWIHDRRAVAGGLSLGMFISMTPTIPLQMVIAAGGALYFRFNLPIAMAACWVTNPLTLAPIYLTAWKLGRYILEEVALIEDFFDFYTQHSRIGNIVRQSAYLWTGSLILATLAAAGAYLAVWLLWSSIEKLLRIKRPAPERVPPEEAP